MFEAPECHVFSIDVFTIYAFLSKSRAVAAATRSTGVNGREERLRH